MQLRPSHTLDARIIQSALLLNNNHIDDVLIKRNFLYAFCFESCNRASARCGSRSHPCIYMLLAELR